MRINQNGCQETTKFSPLTSCASFTALDILLLPKSVFELLKSKQESSTEREFRECVKRKAGNLGLVFTSYYYWY